MLKQFCYAARLEVGGGGGGGGGGWGNSAENSVICSFRRRLCILLLLEGSFGEGDRLAGSFHGKNSLVPWTMRGVGGLQK